MNKVPLLILISLITLFTIPDAALAQNGYIIQGKIKGWTPRYVYLERRTPEGRILDSVQVKDDSFIFKGKVNQPTPAFIVAKVNGEARTRFIYLENSKINITGKFASLGDAKVTGSKTHTQYETIRTAHNDIRNKRENLFSYQIAGDSAKIKAAAATSDSLAKADLQLSRDLIKNNPDSYVSLDEIPYLYNTVSYKELTELFGGLNPDLKNSDKGQRIDSYLNTLSSVQVGKKAPEFTQADTSGKNVSLSDFKGKYVLVDFWASWCIPCRAENPNVVKMYNKYKEKNFTIVGISLDSEEGVNQWKNIIHRDKLTWTQLCDLKGGENEVALLYGVESIPANFLIDPDGVIIASNLRGEDLQKKLQEIFP